MQQKVKQFFFELDEKKDDFLVLENPNFEYWYIDEFYGGC